jgi:predicted  nucleic acid-binding Zn-ribbon protein
MNEMRPEKPFNRGNATGHIESALKSLHNQINELDEVLADLVRDMQPVLNTDAEEIREMEKDVDPKASAMASWITEMDDKVLNLTIVVKNLLERSEL